MSKYCNIFESFILESSFIPKFDNVINPLLKVSVDIFFTIDNQLIEQFSVEKGLSWVM